MEFYETDTVPSAANAPAEQTTQPPHDAEAERCIVGSVLLDNAALTQAAAIVSHKDFYHPSIGLVFESMAALHKRGEPIDVVTVGDELRKRDRLNTVGGHQFLGELTESTPTAAHIEQWARIVADLAAIRRTARHARELYERAMDGASLDSLAALAERCANATACRQDRAPADAIEMANVLWDRLEADERGEPPLPGLSTGLRDLDAALAGGLRGGRLYVVGARPGAGKSAFAGQLALQTMRAQVRVLFFSLEMTRAEVFARLACSHAGVNGEALECGTLDADARVQLQIATADLAKYPLLVDDDEEVGFPQIRARALREHAKRPVGLVVVDYLQLMATEEDDDETRDRKLGKITAGLKKLAKALDAPVVLLSQLKREGEGRRPNKAMLRESGCIENDANVIVLLHRDEQKPTVQEFILAKNRHGSQGIVLALWQPTYTRFVNLAHGTADVAENEPESASQRRYNSDRRKRGETTFRTSGGDAE